ncbi:MAG: glycoside hydrolase family 88 protein [Candidatus Marinimicrobia bacterium]|nr:glycoside hydrolase family 88 protein [Candidatus Neomarinimicrobiota bacterium]
MNRRNFLIKAIAGGSVLPFAASNANCNSEQEKNISKGLHAIRERVKLAMLTMQRASWEQGVAAQAFLESGQEKEMILMAREAVLRQNEAGRLAVLYHDWGSTDPAASGEAVLKAAKILDSQHLKKAADKMLNYLLNNAPRTKDGILFHPLEKPEIWVDSLYMAPPFLAAAGRPQEAIKQIKGIRKYLWNKEAQLFSHQWNVKNQEFTRKDFWGVGNGWAATGITRVIDLLPETMDDEKQELIEYTRQVLEGCFQYIREDYFFHNVLDDQSTFVETNLSQMLSYTIFRGIKSGWLEKEYLEVANAMRKAVHTKVDRFGYVQDVCGAPFFDGPGRATEGQAFFLLMEAAYDDLT